MSAWACSSLSSPQCEYLSKYLPFPHTAHQKILRVIRRCHHDLHPCASRLFFCFPPEPGPFILKVKWSRRTLSSKSEASVSDSSLFINLMVADLIQVLSRVSLTDEHMQHSFPISPALSYVILPLSDRLRTPWVWPRAAVYENAK